MEWAPFVTVAGGLLVMASTVLSILGLVRRGGTNDAQTLLTGYANRVKELEIDNERCQARVTTLEARVVGLERVLDTKEIDRQREVQALYRQNDELRTEIKDCRRDLDAAKRENDDLKRRLPADPNKP